MPRVQHRRGTHSSLPTSGMLAGELLITTDRKNLHVAEDATTRFTPTPQVDALSTMGAVNLSADLLLIHDADGTGQRERKITVQALKDSLGIPEASTDEKVSVVSGGTPGYLWGTDGTDGVIRMGAGMEWTKDSGNGFVTLLVGTIDCGTF
ncbi:hypothetical protein [Tepidiforma sp.]|uniref:hypothetical protein n=1 Tax=Tepidiforma sp. TaxID=2682230 RepID=UPI00262CECDB|nr:hypothetical protein [Tepidiforma sp.]MCX7618277.1 hypothetical protein [Tepidiforma sp.]